MILAFQKGVASLLFLMIDLKINKERVTFLLVLYFYIFILRKENFS